MISINLSRVCISAEHAENPSFKQNFTWKLKHISHNLEETRIKNIKRPSKVVLNILLHHQHKEEKAQATVPR